MKNILKREEHEKPARVKKEAKIKRDKKKERAPRETQKAKVKESPQLYDEKTSVVKIAFLGNIPEAPFISQGCQLVTDYKDADYIISDIKTLQSLPKGIIPREVSLCVLSTGKPSDLRVRHSYPNALLFNNIESMITHIKDAKSIGTVDIDPQVRVNKLTVLPGARAANNNLSMQKGGVVFIACPSRPAMASELAGRLSTSIENTALICAAAESTAAINLGVDANSLIENDWRFPGSIAPIHHKGVCVWPVDPYKHSNPITPYDVHRLVEQVKHKFILVIVDCSGSLSYCSRIAHDEAIIVLRKEKDTSDLTTTQWLSNYKGQNVLEILPSETLAITEAENGILIGTQVNTNTGRGIL